MLTRGRVLAIALWAISAPAADQALQPLTVCEVLSELPQRDRQAVAVLGRFSFRRDGRSLNEETCATQPESSESGTPHAIRLVDDAKEAPRPPEVFSLDAAAVARKLKLIQAHTVLRTFRFGTPDYDRWAVVYGRIETEKGKTAAAAMPRLVYRGDGVVLFLHEN